MRRHCWTVEWRDRKPNWWEALEGEPLEYFNDEKEETKWPVGGWVIKG
jgi:hypothetical protein